MGLALQDQVTALLAGLLNGVIVSAGGIVLGLLIGVPAGALRHSGGLTARWLLAAYVNLFRCTPVLVQIVLLFYALPDLGIRLSAFQTAWLALGLWGGAYQTETFRAGYAAVPPHEIRAARALGLPALRTFLDITLPLGLRNALPAATATAITQFRTSSFMVVIGLPELTYAANRIVSETFQTAQVFGTAALLYLAVSALIGHASRRLERRLGVGRRA